MGKTVVHTPDPDNPATPSEADPDNLPATQQAVRFIELDEILGEQEEPDSKRGPLSQCDKLWPPFLVNDTGAQPQKSPRYSGYQPTRICCAVAGCGRTPARSPR